MLTELQEVHDALENHLQRLRDVLDDEQPSSTEVAAARWRLSSAIRGRKQIIEHIVLPAAAAEATPAEAQILARLRSEELAVTSQLSGHTASWTLQRIQSDWNGYRTAAAQLRERIRHQIRAERSALYPMLQRRLARPAPTLATARA